MASPKTHSTLRKYHRWLGFFLAGIIAVYSTSGTLLIFRKTELLKYDQQEQRQLAPELSAKNLGKELGIKEFDVLAQNDVSITFKQGQYNKTTGLATVIRTDYHPILQQLVNLHKATTNSPLYWLNISFALSLLFFVVSAFLCFYRKLNYLKTALK